MDALRAELAALQARRSEVEAQLAVHAERLNQPGQPGMEGPLLDKEGFPRSDIDVAGVRAARHAIICLTNDHKALTDELAAKLHQLHALARESGAAPAPPTPGQQQEAGGAHEDKRPRLEPAAGASSSGSSGGGPGAAAAAAATSEPGAGLRPFAVVDEVAEGSPAAAAGISLGDQLIRFGSAAAGPSALQDVAAQLAANEDRVVETLWLRHGSTQLALPLTPRRWQGRGLLGCHLRPL